MVTELARDMETSGGRGLTLTARIGELSVDVIQGLIGRD